MRVSLRLTILGFTAAAGCSSSQTAFVAVHNASGGDIPSVSLSSGGVLLTEFSRVLANANSDPRELSIADLSGISVACANDACESGEVNLMAETDNLIRVSPYAPPAIVADVGLEAPAIGQTAPPDGAVDVGTNTSLRVVFDAVVDADTVTAITTGDACSSSVQLSADDFVTCVAMAAAPASVDDRAFDLTPAANLQANTAYQLRVTPSVTGTTGTPLDAALTVGFTTGGAADDVAPSPIADLATGAVTADSVTLSWTASGDDADTGTAQSYRVRYAASACPMPGTGLSEASGTPAPKVAGSTETFVVTGLHETTTYCFDLIVSDEVPNAAAPSNAVSATTPVNIDEVGPGTAVLSVSGASTSSLRVAWTAVGDDGNTGTVASHALRYGTSCPAHNASDFTSGAPVSGMTAPKVAGSAESIWVGGLSSGTHYCFVLRVADEVGNVAFSGSATGATSSSSSSW